MEDPADSLIWKLKTGYKKTKRIFGRLLLLVLSWIYLESQYRL